ncbi:unnamed protein product [Ambrosiozyma monospora]|uniref:Unnamed protein product n=1 Tax=Ambrosiozyma monospora TaxID=43982 RepID=A0ACB5T648_AMBMO|nr:unnamed protein product [Ambrosiozyma monospora]
MSGDLRGESLMKFKPSRRSPLSENENEGMCGKKRKRSLPTHQRNKGHSSQNGNSAYSIDGDGNTNDNSYKRQHMSSTDAVNDSTASSSSNVIQERGTTPNNNPNPNNTDMANNSFLERGLSDLSSADEADDEYEDGTAIPPGLLIRFKKFPLFQNAPNAFFTALGRCLKPVQYNPQEYIVKSGEPAKSMYWILRGTVGVTSTDGEAVYAELTTGSFFGEIEMKVKKDWLCKKRERDQLEALL